MDLLDLYGRASEWTLVKAIGAASDLDAPTPCEGWDVRTLMNHMLDTQRYFVGTALGEDATLPQQDPPSVLGVDPVADFRDARSETLKAFGADGVVEKTGPMLGIAFSDQLVHGWDLARATGQDVTMPEGLAETAFEMIHGRFTDEQRQGVFAAAVEIPDGSSAQDRLLAYTGRDPG